MNIPARQSAPPSPYNALHAPLGFRLLHATHFSNNTIGEWTHRLSLPTWLMEIYRGGEVEVRVAGIGKRTMREKVGLLLPPQTIYRERRVASPDQTAPASSTFIQFDEQAAHAASLLGLDGAAPFWIEDPHGNLQPILDRMIAAVHGRGWMALSAMSLFYQVLALIASARHRRQTLVLSNVEDAAPDFVVVTNDYMRNHLSDPTTVTELASLVGMSGSGFAHAYRRATGRSPMTALRALRVEAAKLYLVRGRFKLETIARQTGFADAFHLSRVFKRIVGVSPREFLKSRTLLDKDGK